MIYIRFYSKVNLFRRVLYLQYHRDILLEFFEIPNVSNCISI